MDRPDSDEASPTAESTGADANPTAAETADGEAATADPQSDVASEVAAADGTAADGAAADGAAADGAAADGAAPEGTAGEVAVAGGEVVAADPAPEAPARAAAAAATPGFLATIRRIFWLDERLSRARAEGFGADKPGHGDYELARDGLVAAQRLGELAESKQGVLLLHREALLLLIGAELARRGLSEPGMPAEASYADFAALDSVRPRLEKLSADDRLAVERALASGGSAYLAGLAKDRRDAVAKVMASLATDLGDELEREANRVASVLYQRWLRILGVVGAILVLVVGTIWLVRRGQTGPNLARGKPVKISEDSPKYGVPIERAVDGNRTDLGFHTKKMPQPWVEIDLGEGGQRIHRVVAYNRATNPERAVPLVLEVAVEPGQWEEVARREESFSVWTADFSRRKARWVRLRLDAENFLHLAEVEVY